MSSSDASDLVDSDEDGVAPAPAPSPSRKRLLRVGSSPLPASTSSPARAGGKKRKRLEGGDGSIPGLPSRAKGEERGLVGVYGKLLCTCNFQDCPWDNADLNYCCAGRGV